jgi:hypothetical protein
VNWLINKVMDSDPRATEIAILATSATDGGDLEDLSRAVALYGEHDPRLLLKNIRSKGPYAIVSV